ncbi:MAG: hypothetical protein CMH49_02870 [Myxococcales bacterium]|nr:hypothetical protein [Myxococcales bacterium]
MDYNLLLIMIGICGVSYILLSLLWYTWYLGIGPTASSHIARQIMIKRVLELRTQLNQQDTLDKQTQPHLTKDPKPLNSVKVYELGSGWGGLSVSLAQQSILYDKKQGRSRLTTPIWIQSYELAFIPYLYSKLYWHLHQIWNKAFQAQTEAQAQTQTILPVRLIFQNTDFISSIASLEAKSILMAYLCPKQMTRIADRLAQINQPLGIYLLSLTFALPGHQAIHVERIPNVFRDPLYLYLI